MNLNDWTPSPITVPGGNSLFSWGWPIHSQCLQKQFACPVAWFTTAWCTTVAMEANTRIQWFGYVSENFWKYSLCSDKWYLWQDPVFLHYGVHDMIWVLFPFRHGTLQINKKLYGMITFILNVSVLTGLVSSRRKMTPFRPLNSFLNMNQTLCSQ